MKPSIPSFLIPNPIRRAEGVAGFPLAGTAGGFCDEDPCPASSALEFLHCFQLTVWVRVGLNPEEIVKSSEGRRREMVVEKENSGKSAIWGMWDFSP